MVSKKKTSQNENQFKEVYQDGLRVFKEGLLGLELMANKTVSVAKLKLNTTHLEKEFDSKLKSLGKVVFEKLSGTRTSTLKIDPELKKTILDIKKLKKTIEDNQKQLSKSTSVDKPTKTTKVKRKPAQKTKSSIKAKSKKTTSRTSKSSSKRKSSSN
jgi:hypothetical protein